METNGEIKIEKGVPMPSGAGRPKINILLLQAMKVGDSVLVTPRKAKSLYISARTAKVRVAARSEEGMTRVWRVK